MTAILPALGLSRQAVSLPILGRAHNGEIVHSQNLVEKQGDGVPNKLRELRLARGWTMKKAADAAGMSFGQYVKLERGERRMTDIHLSAMARAYEVPIYALLEGVDTVRLAGHGGPDLDGLLTWEPGGLAPAPIGSSPNTAAVEIRGGVLRGLATGGWFCYFEDVREPVNETTLGELSVVALATGEHMIRTPRPGSRAGLFHLEGANLPTIYDAEVLWAAIVSSIIPGKIAQRMLSGEQFKSRSAPFKKDIPKD